MDFRLFELEQYAMDQYKKANSEDYLHSFYTLLFFGYEHAATPYEICNMYAGLNRQADEFLSKRMNAARDVSFSFTTLYVIRYAFSRTMHFVLNSFARCSQVESPRRQHSISIGSMWCGRMQDWSTTIWIVFLRCPKFLSLINYYIASFPVIVLTVHFTKFSNKVWIFKIVVEVMEKQFELVIHSFKQTLFPFLLSQFQLLIVM